MVVGIISHVLCSEHDMGESHPECPARLTSIEKHLGLAGLDEAGLDKTVENIEAVSIPKALLSLAHDDVYIDYVFDNSPNDGLFPLDLDTTMTPSTLAAALLSAGAAVQAVDLVMENKVTAVFCATRPPGHHAERNKAMGFCFFNNVAIAAAYAKQKYQLKKIAIVDFDVHHGNGTEDIVSGQPGVLFCSTFQHPFYPFSGVSDGVANGGNDADGHGETASNVINTPLSANAGSAEFRQAIRDHWLPALNQFKPEMIIISAGFDAHAEDDMSQVQLYDEDYRWVTDELKFVADQYCQGRMVSVLEGGYNLEALGRSVVAHIQGLIG
ncbi:MAG: acetoin utilization deacetylase AcuC-like enzyme [Polaribacter sp.]|jgi:acetoin utilization deacetylase AcuC-like enzyme